MKSQYPSRRRGIEISVCRYLKQGSCAGATEGNPSAAPSVELPVQLLSQPRSEPEEEPDGCEEHNHEQALAECRPIELGEPAGLQGEGTEREKQRDDKDATTNPSRHDQCLVGVQPDREDDESHGEGCQESGPEAVVEQRPPEPLAGCERQHECCDRQTAVQQQDSQLGRKLQL